MKAIGPGLAAALLCVAGARADYVMECNSGGYSYTYCAADTRSGVEFDRQTSSADCTIDDSWGYDAGGVWVDKGCRGRFHILAAGPAPFSAPAAAAADPVPDEILASFRDDDAEHGREPGYGAADAITACARAAETRAAARGDRTTVSAVDRVTSRGRRTYDVRFVLAVIHDGAGRAATARCTVADGAVTAFSAF